MGYGREQQQPEATMVTYYRMWKCFNFDNFGGRGGVVGGTQNIEVKKHRSIVCLQYIFKRNREEKKAGKKSATNNYTKHAV